MKFSAKIPLRTSKRLTKFGKDGSSGSDAIRVASIEGARRFYQFNPLTSGSIQPAQVWQKRQSPQFNPHRLSIQPAQVFFGFFADYISRTNGHIAMKFSAKIPLRTLNMSRKFG